MGFPAYKSQQPRRDSVQIVVAILSWFDADELAIVAEAAINALDRLEPDPDCEPEEDVGADDLGEGEGEGFLHGTDTEH